MNLSQSDIDRAAADLLQAEETREQIGLLSLRHPGLTLDDAYAIQAAQMAQKLASGRTIAGWKIGLTSKVMQRALNIDTPDSGVLYDDMVFDHGATVPKGRFIQPRVEAEIAFVTKSDLSGKVTAEQVMAATDYVQPALEVIDSRFSGFKFDLESVIADNSSSARYVPGGRMIRPDALDLRTVGVVLEHNGDIAQIGAGAEVLGHPAEAIAMLVGVLDDMGEVLPAGSFVMAGAITAAVAVKPGDTITARFYEMGSITVTFTE